MFTFQVEGIPQHRQLPVPTLPQMHNRIIEVYLFCQIIDNNGNSAGIQIHPNPFNNVNSGVHLTLVCHTNSNKVKIQYLMGVTTFILLQES